MKKILALVLALAMIATLGLAFAADGDLNIVIAPQNARNSLKDQTFSAYKLFDGVYGESNSVAYTIDPTTNAFYLNATTKGILENYFTFTQSTTDEHVMYVEPIETSGVSSDTRALADALAGKIPSGATAYTAEGTATGATIDVKAGGKGFYLVTGSVIPADPANGTEPVTTAIALLNVKAETNSINAKADTPTLTKEITAVKEGSTTIAANKLDDAGKAAVAKVGSTVEYKLTSVVPIMTSYTAYQMVFTDVMDAGLTFDENVSLKIGSTTGISTTGLYEKSGNGFILTLDKAFLDNYNAGDVIEITYSATVNANSIEYDFEKNTATLQYSNNPYDTNSHETTPPQETFVINIKIDVLKYGATTADVLEGAEFKLYKVVGTGDEATNVYYKLDATDGVTWVDFDDSDTFVTDATGAFANQIKGLDQGTYYLEETKAPTGYNLLKDAIPVTITATYNDDGTVKKVTYTSTEASITKGVVNLSGTHTENESALATMSVQNQQGTELPSTGGIGTTIFYIVGGILLIGAAVILVARRKAHD